MTENEKLPSSVKCEHLDMRERLRLCPECIDKLFLSQAAALERRVRAEWQTERTNLFTQIERLYELVVLAKRYLDTHKYEA